MGIEVQVSVLDWLDDFEKKKTPTEVLLLVKPILNHVLLRLPAHRLNPRLLSQIKSIMFPRLLVNLEIRHRHRRTPPLIISFIHP